MFYTMSYTSLQRLYIGYFHESIRYTFDAFKENIDIRHTESVYLGKYEKNKNSKNPNLNINV